MSLNGLEPSNVFHFFEEISNIPRGSGNEKEISDYIVNFAKDRELKYIQDEAHNVLIEKEATVGYENSDGVILQGHIDMVCEKNAGTEHDFIKDPLKLKAEGDFIFAEGTTLGADDGIAVAYMLAILDSDNISHPHIECVFTTDEERGMTGATYFNASGLKGKYMINFDTEGEGHLLVGGCGGLKATISLPVQRTDAKPGLKPYELLIKGLKGGHSGADIIFQRANSNKLMGRVLKSICGKFYIELAHISGGMVDNAIPREAKAIVFAEGDKIREINSCIEEMKKIIDKEYKYCEEGINVSLLPSEEKSLKVFDGETLKKIIALLILIPSGIIRMDFNVEELVETSTNLGVVETKEESVDFISALRSSLESKKYETLDILSEASKLVDAKLIVKGEYPGWEYNPDSKLVNLFSDVYLDMYGKRPEIKAVHAGVECGIFAGKKRDLDIVAIGPDILDIHSPKERMSISSAGRVYAYTLKILSLLK
ncbi:MAG: aminoacyl-histidine dipeptidase [Lachnospiraceae bacterium]|nr:aminoacyl-histidine dipeptidase [Lachnospiraceae bacterium]